MSGQETKMIIDEIGNILTESNRYLSERNTKRAKGLYLTAKMCYGALGKNVPEIKEGLYYLEKELNPSLTKKRSIAERVRDPTSNETFVPNFFALDEDSKNKIRRTNLAMQTHKGERIKFGEKIQ